MKRFGIYCPECYYDLTGLRVRECPECGTAFDPAELAEAAFHYRFPWPRIALQLAWPPALTMILAGFFTGHGSQFWFGAASVVVPIVCVINAAFLANRIAPDLHGHVVYTRKNMLAGFVGCVGIFVVAQLLVMFMGLTFGCFLSGFSTGFLARGTP